MVCLNSVLLVLQKKCRHALCRTCAKKGSGECPKCKETDQTFDEAPMGSVFICTHQGGRCVKCVWACQCEKYGVLYYNLIGQQI